MKYLGWLLLCGCIAFAQRSVMGSPIDILGLESELQRGAVQKSTLEPNQLRLETDFGQFAVQGYPKWLTLPLQGTALLALYRFLPDGPEARLEFSRNRSTFLLLGSRSSQKSLAVGNWRWGSFNTRSAQLDLLPKSQTIPLGKPVLVKQGLLYWCMHLAAIHLPTPETPSVSNEAERPRFDWVAWRVARAEQCR
ncbi:MAG: hypothetical protein ACK41E_04955 [Deinococcales bacterium]